MDRHSAHDDGRRPSVSIEDAHDAWSIPRPPIPAFSTPPHSHSIVRIGPSELICRSKNFSALKTPVARTVRCAWLLNSKRNLIALEILRFQPYQYRSVHFSQIHWHRRAADIAEDY